MTQRKNEQIKKNPRPSERPSFCYETKRAWLKSNRIDSQQHWKLKIVRENFETKKERKNFKSDKNNN